MREGVPLVTSAVELRLVAVGHGSVCTSLRSGLRALEADLWASCLGFYSNIHCQLWNLIYTDVAFQLMSNHGSLCATFFYIQKKWCFLIRNDFAATISSDFLSILPDVQLLIFDRQPKPELRVKLGTKLVGVSIKVCSVTLCTASYFSISLSTSTFILAWYFIWRNFFHMDSFRDFQFKRMLAVDWWKAVHRASLL